MWFRLCLDIIVGIEAAKLSAMESLVEKLKKMGEERKAYTYRGSNEFTEGLYTKYVCGWKLPAVLLQKCFDKLTPYGSFYVTESIMCFLTLSLSLLPLSHSFFFSIPPSLPPISLKHTHPTQSFWILLFFVLTLFGPLQHNDHFNLMLCIF